MHDIGIAQHAQQFGKRSVNRQQRRRLIPVVGRALDPV